jgi:4-hydroxybenzoate polyprenyltransferase
MPIHSRLLNKREHAVNTPRALVRLARPQQYAKNLFIFLPLFFSGNLFHVELLLPTVIGFVSFSLCASAVYVFNDLRDRVEDREHPEKKFRPLASGAVTVNQAWMFLFSLLFPGIAIAFASAPLAGGILLGYLAMNVAYSLGLKHVAPLDVFLIATGFVIRLLFGAALTGIALSQWIVVMTFLLAMFLALAKRRDDVLLTANTGAAVRKSIKGYNRQFLDTSLGVMAGVTLVAYIMYTMSEHAQATFGTEHLYLTFAFVLLGILRYLQIALVEERSGSPTAVFLQDKMLRFVLLGWLSLFLVLIYFK